jgi:hypothetical protein
MEWVRTEDNGFVVDKMALTQVFCKPFAFSYQFPFHQLLHTQLSYHRHYIVSLLTALLRNKLKKNEVQYFYCDLLSHLASWNGAPDDEILNQLKSHSHIGHVRLLHLSSDTFCKGDILLGLAWIGIHSSDSDLKLLDIFLWGYFKTKFCNSTVNIREELCHWSKQSASELKSIPRIFECLWVSFSCTAEVCVWIWRPFRTPIRK